jgi:hypothetical protein
MHHPHRQIGPVGDIGLRQTDLDPRRSDGSGEGKLVRWATHRTSRHGLERYSDP